MNRLQKKCVFASTGFHLLLLVILFVGPAFLSSKNKPEDFTVLEFIPMITTDAVVAPGGGTPIVPPPPPQPPAPQPQPPSPPPQVTPQPPQPPPQPVKEIVRPPEPSLKPPEKKPRLPEVDTTKLVVRKPTTPVKTPSTDNNAEAKRRQTLNRTLDSLRQGLSSRTTVEMPGPGGGGPTYANYKQLLASIYYQAWQEPEDASADAGTVVATVTVARDGTVLSARIIRHSGDLAIDRSVHTTLERVKFIAPFPEGSKDQQRTFTVNFNAKAKRGLG